MQGMKHLVECNCILPQMKGKEKAIFHSFVVFSNINDDGDVLEKFSQCNNCGAIHRVYDICKSEILKKESHILVQTIQDVSLSIPSELSSILVTYKCEIATWEHVQFIYLNQLWGEYTLVSRETENGITIGKRLIIEGPTKFKIEPITFTETV